MASSLLRRLVNPDLRWRSGWCGWTVETLWMSGMCLVKNHLAALENLVVPTSMHISRSKIADTAMVVAVAVPGEKVPAPTAGSLDGREALWIVRTVLHGLELRFAIGVIV
jgi:hypothetical protein